MKYTFTTENNESKTITIADEVFIQGRKEGLSNREIIDRYLSDEGYIINPVVAELTEKAKANKVGAAARSGKRKAPTRKPDETKRALIQMFKETLDEFGHGDTPLNGIHSVEVTNIERMIAFSIGDDKYELTLSKKRKPKA